MPANPTRKTEVQAYSFEIRRMNSALVRKDPVMVHDPLRTHSRATIVGVILSAIGLLGFLIFGIIKPKPQAPAEGIVIGKDSGQIYVKVKPKQVPDPTDPTKKINQPSMLIPTYNLASARLLLQNPNETDKSPQDIQAQNPTVVPDDRLDDIPVGPMQGIPDANVLLPTMEQRISDNWSVCNSLTLNMAEPPDARLKDAKKSTAILAGTTSVRDQLKELPSGEAILVNVGGLDQLIYRPTETVNRKSNIVRANIAHADTATREALKLNDTAHNRPISPTMLNAIESVGDLTAPEIPNQGQPTPYSLGAAGNARVGQVFQVQNPGKTSYYVMLKDGKQEISQAAATIIRYKYGQGQTGMPTVAPADVPTKDADPKNFLQLDNFPDQIPQLLDPNAYPTMCLDWHPEGQSFRTSMYFGSAQTIPYPKSPDPQEACDQNTGSVCPTPIGPEDSDIKFYMPAHHAAVVHAATGDATFQSGPIQLISDAGIRYGVPDVVTAAHLGLYVHDDKSIRPAPSLIVSQLPAGTGLNTTVAQRVTPFQAPPSGSDTSQQAGG